MTAVLAIHVWRGWPADLASTSVGPDVVPTQLDENDNGSQSLRDTDAYRHSLSRVLLPHRTRLPRRRSVVQLDKLRTRSRATRDCSSLTTSAHASAAMFVVVSPSTVGRPLDGRPIWLGHVPDCGAIDYIGAWVRSGGPRIRQPPDTIDLYSFLP